MDDKTLAELIAGLEVPRSIGALGAAQAPYDAIRIKLGLFGWHTADDVLAAIVAYKKNVEG